MMRFAFLLLVNASAACGTEVSLGVDLEHANLRAVYQTDPASVLVTPGDLDQPYDVLADLDVTVRQRSTFGDLPTREQAALALQQQAGRIGAHAVILVGFGEPGMSWWSYHELRGQGRAVRFR